MLRRLLPLFVCCLLLPSPTHGDEPLAPDGTPLRDQRGLIFERKGDQTAVSAGGVFLPRKIKVTTAAADGPVTTRIAWPSEFHSPAQPAFPDCIPGTLRVLLPDEFGLVYFGDELIAGDGLVRQYETPPLALGKAYPLHLRAAFRVGNHLLIQDQDVVLRPGMTTLAAFDGRGAQRVALPRSKTP